MSEEGRVSHISDRIREIFERKGDRMAWASMTRAGSWAVFGVLTAAGIASARDLPPLVAPESPPPREAPAAAPPTAPPATRDRSGSLGDDDRRPVLALPGLNAPRSRPSGAPSAPPSLSPDQTDALPPLISPIAPSSNSGSSEPPAMEPLPSRRFRPGIVESVPRSAETSTSTPAPRRTPVPEAGVVRPPVRPESIRDRFGPRAYDEATNNRSRILNLLAPPRGPGTPMPESSISTEPRADPAADAALKRRVEKQAQQAVAGRAREVEVRVVGRIVTIQAKGVRFLQKRAVRKSLESLPILDGYRTVIDVRD
ncbi:MAG: hypothetical protein SFX72_09220 [Isosphaeraceae bacterium]|nr:hypothetical protein [Isosphaeraceae bacterium]